MATVNSANATATRYVANGKDVWVPSQSLNSSTAVGGAALPEALKSIYGKIFTTVPSYPADGQLYYGTDASSRATGHTILQYFDSTEHDWVDVLDTDRTTGAVYDVELSTGGATPSEAAKIAAAQSKLLTEEAGVGDVVIVHWTEGVSPDEVVKAESYICFHIEASTPAQATDYQVCHMTSEDAKEVEYNGAAGNFISHASTPTVEACLTALDTAIVSNADFGRYALASASTSGNEALTFANEGADKNFNGYTGVLKLTCCIDCGDHSSTGYVSTGIITCTVIDGNIEATSMSLADYYVESYEEGLPGDTYMDIFDLDFAIANDTHKLVVKTPAYVAAQDKIIVSGTKVTVKVQW